MRSSNLVYNTNVSMMSQRLITICNRLGTDFQLFLIQTLRYIQLTKALVANCPVMMIVSHYGST